MTTIRNAAPEHSGPEPREPAAADSLLISEHASLYDAMARLENCRTGFTIFAVDGGNKVVGVLTRGDVIRFLQKMRPKKGKEIAAYAVRDAMTPRGDGSSGRPEMLYIVEGSSRTWYQQLTEGRSANRSRWNRITLIPILNSKMQLVNVLDLESPRARTRLETLVMAEAFPFDLNAGPITDTAMAHRRSAFDSVHYTTHRKKLTGLCSLLLKRIGGQNCMLNDVFNNARADEIVLGLFRSEEWLNGHVSNADMKADDQRVLLAKVLEARDGLVTRYLNAGKAKNFPAAAGDDVYKKPELIIVLGCRPELALRERVSAAWSLVTEVDRDHPSPTLVLSGGGDGHELSEAQRMLEELGKLCKAHGSASMDYERAKTGWWILTIEGRAVNVVLEEDSLDTLGNAVFSWLTLKLEGSRYGLRAADQNRLERLVLVTDGIHAPRSYDIFRRVFAFRSEFPDSPGPKIAVRTVDRTMASSDERSTALEHLRSEARVNTEIWRLVNPLTNGFDVIEDGHVRSILGQMLRLHRLYHGRWDLVRKYQRCWHDDRRDSGHQC